MKKRITLLIMAVLLFAGMVSAQKNWMQGWDGGTAMGVGSEPDKFGWLCDKADFDGWEVADSEVSGTVRYSTTLAKQCAIFDKADPDNDEKTYYDNNRLLIIRWDNNFVNYYAYKLSGLSAGKTYRYDWVYAWYDNASRCELRVGINKNPVSTITDNTNWGIGEDENDDIYYQYFFEIMDDLRGPTDGFPYDQKKTVHPASFEFSVPEDGDYYVTITCTHVVSQDPADQNDAGSPSGPMAMVGGFSVVDAASNSVNSVSDDQVFIWAENGNIVVDGADNYNVYSMSGVKMNPDTKLSAGIYIVEVNGKTYKTIVK